jgi:hypothetical protein
MATEVDCLSDQWSTSSLFFVSFLSAPLKLQVPISAGSQLHLIYKAQIWQSHGHFRYIRSEKHTKKSGHSP